MLFLGVHNRNHCPYCPWSRHMDFYTAGDWLSACKSLIQPIGLALKRSPKKYGLNGLGKLMLIHRCTEFGKVSVNRLAADDDTDTILEVYETSPAVHWRLEGIRSLSTADRPLVCARLYGLC